jgi:hypothetical protein
MKVILKNLPKGIINVLTIVFYTLKYNWFYILLAILAPLAIYAMGAGREIVSLLFDGEKVLLNNCALALTLFGMSMTIWLVPSLSIYPILLYSSLTLKTKRLNVIEYYKHMINRYSVGDWEENKSQHNQVPAKYLAMLPWAMLCSTLIQFNLKNSSLNTSLWIFIGLVVLLFSLLAAWDGYLLQKRNLLIWGLVATVASVACLIYNFISCGGDDLWQVESCKSVVICAISLFLMFLVFRGLTRGDEEYRKVQKGSFKQQRLRLSINNVLHLVIFVLNVAALLMLTYLAIHANLVYTSTITILLLCFNFYILAFDFVITSQVVLIALMEKYAGTKPKVVNGYKLLTGALFIGFLFFIFSTNTNKYNHKIPSKDIENEQNLENYFDNWYSNKKQNMPNSAMPMNVYLISGQGGGSRAAIFFLAVLHRIEKSRDKELYQQTFSISTISGSSAGLGQYIAIHQNERLIDSINSKKTDTTFKNLKNIYHFNYFNSNMLGLLFYDRIPIWLKNLMHTPKSNTYSCFNRNYIQELEEQKQLKIFTKSMIGENDIKYEFLQNNILDLYKHNNNPYSTPLVFFNTTVLNQGRKGIFSPLEDEDLIGNDIDLLQCNKPVSFHFAELSSQSFPLLNNFSSLDSNYFGDGGIYENSGTSTTLQIYKRLRRHCNGKGYKVRFIMLNLLNGVDKTATTACEKKPTTDSRHDNKSIVSLLTTTLASMPFNGHENDAKIQLTKEATINNRFLGRKAIKDSSINIQPYDAFALSRVFTQKSLNKFIDSSTIDSYLENYSKYRQWVDVTDHLVAAQQGKASKATPIIYRLYTQYRNPNDREKVKEILLGIADYVVSIPPIELVSKATYTNEIRYFHDSEKNQAEALKNMLVKQNKGLILKVSHVTDPQLSAKTPAGQMELWIDYPKRDN